MRHQNNSYPRSFTLF